MSQLYPAPNLDVDQMQADFAAVAQQQYGMAGYYTDQQAMMTGYRASYGDIPAMLMSGIQTTGSAFMGAAQGVGSVLSTVGSMIKPITYTPPAQVYTGYYGQYQQQTGLMRELAIMSGAAMPPRGVNSYLYGYNAAANLGERAGSAMFATGSVATGLAAGWATGHAGAAIGGVLGSPLGPVGMAAGAMIGGLAGNIAGYMGVDALSEKISQRREIDAFMERSSFRYVGAGSSMADPRLGGGMSFGARREAIDFMKRMDVRDPGMGMEDLYGILQGGTNLGLFAGSRDMEDFKKKFKDVVEGVKAVTKTLNTTLEEGLQVIKDFKSINIDASQMASVSLQASAVGKVTGRTAQEVVGLGLQGAELYRGTGIEMKVGYQAQVMNMAAIRSARDAGLISQEAIVQAGGEEAMSQRMTAGGLQFMQSALGRGFGAAFYNPAAGPAGFDMGAFQRNAMGGGGNLVDLAYRGALNLSNPQAIVDFTINQDKFMSEMGKTFGGRGTQIAEISAAAASAKMYQEIGVAKDFTSGLKYSLMVDQGKTAEQADQYIKMTQNAPREFADKLKALQATGVQQTIDEAYRTTGLHYRWNVLSDKVSEALEPVSRMITNTMDKTKEGVVNWWDRDVKGITRYDYSGMGYRARLGEQLPMVYAPKPRTAGDLTNLSRDEVASRLEDVGVVDISKGGGFWNPTRGEQMVEALEIVGAGSLVEKRFSDQLTADDVIVEAWAPPEVTGHPGWGQKTRSAKRVVSRSALKKELDARKNILEVSKEKALEMAAKDKTIAAPAMDIGGAVSRVTERLGDKATLQDVVKELYPDKKTLGDLEKDEYATLLLAADRIEPLGKIMDREIRTTKALKDYEEKIDVDVKASKEKQYLKIGEDLAKTMGLKNFSGFTQEISKEAMADLESARRLRASGEVGQSRTAVDDAVKKYKAKYPGADEGELRAKFEGYVAGDKKYSEYYGRAERADLDMLGEQVTEGGKKLLESQELALGKLKIEEPVKDRVTTYLKSVFTGTGASRVSALTSLSAESEVGKVIDQLPMGRQLFDAKKALDFVGEATAKLKEIETKKEQGKLDPKEADVQKEAVKKGLEENMAKHMSLAGDEDRKKVVSYTMEGKSSQAQLAVSQALNLQQEQVTGAVAPGARPGATAEASGTTQGTSAEFTAQQININYEILEALRALNVGRR